MKNLKIRTRLLIAFGIILILLVFVSIFSMIRMYYLAEFTTQLYKHPFTVGTAIRDAEINLLKMHHNMKKIAQMENLEQLELAIEEVDQLEILVYKELDTIQKQFLGEPDMVQNLKENIARWKPIRNEVISLIRQNQPQKAAAVTEGRESRYIDKLSDEMKSFAQFANNKAKEFMDEAQSSEHNSYIIVSIIDIIAVLASIVIGYLFASSIIRPVNMVVSTTDRLARGDLSVDISEYSQDEMGMMLASMKRMAENLKDQIHEIVVGIRIISGSTAEISSTTALFAATTKEVSASVNQMVVNMKEIKQTSELSYEKAREMVERAQSVVQTSRSGEAAVQQTIAVINTIHEQVMSIANSVTGLSEQSQSIGEIISAVENIADKSRLLAVNASIEAVKAGEHGKAFNVVADEIKYMAEQSKQSTSQVRSILTDIQKATEAAVLTTEKGSKAVENGVRQASQTGSAIQVLGENINQNAKTAIQIETTNQQQAAGIDHIFSAMESIGNSIEHCAEIAKQLDKSTQDLHELGEKLKLIVDKYNV